MVLANSIGQAVEGVSDRRLAGDFVLVLDDAHAVSAPVLNTVVTGLLERLDPHSEIAVASRTEPARIALAPHG